MSTLEAASTLDPASFHKLATQEYSYYAYPQGRAFIGELVASQTSSHKEGGLFGMRIDSTGQKLLLVGEPQTTDYILEFIVGTASRLNADLIPVIIFPDRSKEENRELGCRMKMKGTHLLVVPGVEEYAKKPADFPVEPRSLLASGAIHRQNALAIREKTQGELIKNFGSHDWRNLPAVASLNLDIFDPKFLTAFIWAKQFFAYVAVQEPLIKKIQEKLNKMTNLATRGSDEIIRQIQSMPVDYGRNTFHILNSGLDVFRPC
ncbi:MAG: hypothetical protein UX87_C0007G0016 [Candidatus Amesbacteria bacterium GW2011_GWA1_47_16]|uniref:Uncharacterized protein n=5 Tax=Candidatus Amesiibacteriota TaxID=1752730 RepID=A0A1F4ZVS9_9BACT|nr:MAG: hypothetical protein UX86_C0010G0006 [Candidatus Amesbacteria bacterium GW2011_GWC1_47_15]KKU64508.1 MAG: hypothetical protein UX87_C0007G0016 [Candidatus Amesbacteria bacterium GW2011_GWA1_47_16]KKU97609.1 MAG: hypothetical protein UY28_C0017G0012 [Candidatus Amesbacteria bacterium GW2011_GWB1_48_13]OGD00385.1 MAG: hypothetical protein A2972_03910 [Candidatus Amesbacteria bacterium RIFCSPLOWO2_01_FULL_47_33]OGD00921.1 MAG: hypothetical protein A2701_04845 [Candidatus Amesbacteria bacte